MSFSVRNTVVSEVVGGHVCCRLSDGSSDAGIVALVVADILELGVGNRVMCLGERCCRAVVEIYRTPGIIVILSSVFY